MRRRLAGSWAGAEIPEGWLSCKLPWEQRGFPPAHQAPKPRAPEPGEGGHPRSGCESQGFCLPGEMDFS